MSNPDLRHQLKSRLLALPPRAFELFAGDLLEFVGLRNVSVTRYSGDGGIDAEGSLEATTDLISISVGVQVKRYRANVQRVDIDRFIGALSGQFQQGIFITTSNYSPQAIQKAQTGIPRVSTLNGDHLTDLMVQHHLGVADRDDSTVIDDAYFETFEMQPINGAKRVVDSSVPYQVASPPAERPATPEDDLISLRALSHALRLDTTTLRHWIERGKFQADLTTASGYLFRRSQIPILQAKLLGDSKPSDAASLRPEFLEFARSRAMTKSYKPVLLRALLRLVNREGEVPIDALVSEFRAFYLERRVRDLPVEFGPPDPTTLTDSALRRLIVRHPLERFLIQGFLSYDSKEGIVRFVPQLWRDLRIWEFVDLQQSIEAQLNYYYQRGR